MMKHNNRTAGDNQNKMKNMNTRYIDLRRRSSTQEYSHNSPQTQSDRVYARQNASDHITNGFDYSYITPFIIAVAYPTDPSMVCRVLSSKHKGRYKIYLLCTEKEMVLEDLNTNEVNITVYPMIDFNPCALRLVETFCNDVEEYLSEDNNNIVAVMCSTGRGRSALLISSYLMFSGQTPTAELAIKHFNTHRGRNGMSTPSQIRYLYYFENMLRRDNLTTYTYRITHIRLHTIPNFDSAISGGGCHPYVVIKTLVQVSRQKWMSKLVFNQLKEQRSVIKYETDDNNIDIDLTSYNIQVRNDVSITFFNKDELSSEKICRIWFHTAFIDKNYLVFEKSYVDKAVFDKKHRIFDKKFRMEIYLHRVYSDEDGVEDTLIDNVSEIEKQILRSYSGGNSIEISEEADGADPEEVCMAEGDFYSDGSSNWSSQKSSVMSDESDLSNVALETKSGREDGDMSFEQNENIISDSLQDARNILLAPSSDTTDNNM